MEAKEFKAKHEQEFKKTTCDRCDGDGQAHGSDRPLEYSGLNSYPGKCPKCKGTGSESANEKDAGVDVSEYLPAGIEVDPQQMDCPSFVKKPVPRIGKVEILRENVEANFKGCKIVQSGGTIFRLHGNEFNVTLSQDDALWIIEELKLGAIKSPFMRRVVIWSNEDKEGAAG